MDPFDLDTFLHRLEIERHDIEPDLVGLTRVQHAVLARIPLHDLHVHDGSSPGVDAGDMARRAQAGLGNWRFGANAALAVVLRAIGFEVAISGAALLLDGPNQRIDHVVLEVSSPALDPHLVDVGLLRSPIGPVRLNAGDVQTLGRGEYQLVPSPQGTTLATIVEDTPVALLRFRRVTHPFEDFAATIRNERARHRARDDVAPSATRLLDPTSFDRVTLTPRRIEWQRSDDVVVRDVDDDDDWNSAIEEWFPSLLVAGGSVRRPDSGVGEQRRDHP